MKLEERLLKPISELVAINDHGGAIAVAAQSLGLNDLADRVASINFRHQRLGYLSPKLSAERSAACAELMSFAKTAFSIADFQRFRGVI